MSQEEEAIRQELTDALVEKLRLESALTDVEDLISELRDELNDWSDER